MTRKITSTVAAIAQGRADRLVLGNLDARRDWGWAPDYVDAMVRAARADEPATTWSRPASATPSAIRRRGVRPRRHRRLGAAASPRDPALVRPADPTDLTGDATRARTTLGWAPTVGVRRAGRPDGRRRPRD